MLTFIKSYASYQQDKSIIIPQVLSVCESGHQMILVPYCSTAIYGIAKLEYYSICFSSLTHACMTSRLFGRSICFSIACFSLISAEFHKQIDFFELQ